MVINEGSLARCGLLNSPGFQSAATSRRNLAKVGDGKNSPMLPFTGYPLKKAVTCEVR